MTGRSRTLAVALPVLMASPMLHAQTSSDLVTQGLAAYRALEYEQAVALLRRALTGTGPGAVPDSVRANGYVYLGAAELFRGRRDPAAAAFRRALVADPRHRPDSLVFPPQVTSVFDTVRRLTAYVRVRAPDTSIAVGDQLYLVQLYASALHDATVDLKFEDGRTARRLYSGPLGDSLAVQWDGLDQAARAPLAGHLGLQVTSRSPAGQSRIVQIPLTVRVLPPDTLPDPPAPADSLFFPEQATAKAPYGTLAAGLISGLTAMVLPSFIAADGRGGSARYVVGGTLGLAGVVGFLTHRSTAGPANVAANQALRDAWQREVEAVRAENERRRRYVRLQITAGNPISTERETP